MKQHVEELVEELQGAINESVRESDHIAAIVADIKAAGYDILLALQATIALKADEKADDAAGERPRQPSGAFQLTQQDEIFLQDLKITAGG
jgi:hypothetical protein